MLKGGGVGRSAPAGVGAVRPVAQPVAETDRSAPSAQPAPGAGKPAQSAHSGTETDRLVVVLGGPAKLLSL